MRSFIALLIVLLFWPAVTPPGATSQTGPKIVDDRAPFAIELPELNSGLLPAGAHLEIPVPAKPPLTRIKLWVVQPFAARIGYRGINATLNGQSLSTVTSKGSGIAGNFLDVDLRKNPNLEWKANKNVLEITAQEERGNIAYRCSFVLLSNRAAAAKRKPGESLAEGCQSELHYETNLAPEDPHVLQSDRVAPQLTLATPTAAFNATSVAQSVLVSGSASDDSGIVRTITVNNQVVASTPVPKDKRFALPPIKKGDKKVAPPPPPPLTFNTSFLVVPGTRAIIIEATDASGNRALVRVPILQPDCADTTVAQRQAALASTTTPGFSKRRYAVVVGVSKYQFHEGGLHDLSYAHRDAESIRDWLRSDGGGGFKANEVICLTDSGATLAAVRHELRSFLTTAGENDLIYLFLAGHGAPDPFDRSKLYFLLHNSKVTDLPNTALAMSEVGQFVNQQSKQARLIAFFDTCHSAGIKGKPLNQPAANSAAAPEPRGGGAKQDRRGVGTKNPNTSGNSTPSPQPTPKPAPATNAGFNFYETSLFRDKGWTVITSSGMSEESQESSKWGGHGVFTWALLEGAQGKADTNNNCEVTAAELAEYVSATVSRETGRAQNPQSLPGSSPNLVVATVQSPGACAGKGR
ncbi:MAG: caspase family protein [Acidobacteriota bacterium]